MENKNQEKKYQENTYYTAKPQFMKNGPSKLRMKFNKWLGLFLVIASSIAFYFGLLRLTNISVIITKIIDVMMPIIYGCVIAYLLNPIVRRVDRYLVPKLEKRAETPEKAKKLSRVCGVTLSILLLLLLIIVLCNLLIPQLYFSIRNMIFTLPAQLNHMANTIDEMAKGTSTTSTFLKTVINEGTNMLEKWLRTDLLAKTNELMSNLTVGVINVISTLFDFVIGIIVSIYLLFSKEQFSMQSKKAIYAIFSPRNANLILHLTRKSDSIFGGFVIGKLIDSAIIGVICFFGMSLLNMPYVMLISVIIGVTNVIPFFGPYIGAVPSAILIILSNPIKGVYFLIFILLLQQFDGNILGPKIIGNSTGLSAFWVIVAILLGGGLFGFVGMIMGVPTFGVIYYIVDALLNSKLEQKNLPVGSENYGVMSYVDDAGTYNSGEDN